LCRRRGPWCISGAESRPLTAEIAEYAEKI
jgi:hypothetical protein